MQEVAAASEEQSASTQEIAAAASTLADASRKLLALVSSFRMEETGTRERRRRTAEIPAEQDPAGAATRELPVEGPTGPLRVRTLARA